MSENEKLDLIEDAIADFAAGRMVIVVDDEDRENEGDLIIPAEKITPEQVNFMLKNARGVLCAPMPLDWCRRLQLDKQVEDNTSVLGTPFTVTVDKLDGCSTGVSINDRCATLNALADPNARAEDFGRPGHINPLYAQNAGVLKRAGHTEAAVDLCRLAGVQPVGVLMEIMSDDGSMARLPELRRRAAEWGMHIISIRDLIHYRREHECLIEKGECVDLPTAYGHFHLIPFRQKDNGLEHIAIIKGDISSDPDIPVLTRVHSSCATGDIFASQRCDCGEQLHNSLRMIEQEGRGCVLYLNQEGRGIGLMDKIRAYKLQEGGMDTVDANLHLGHRADERDYGIGAQILSALGIRRMRLMTNNPTKRIGLEGYGLEVVENVPIEVTPNQYNRRYMQTKKVRMGHKLDL